MGAEAREKETQMIDILIWFVAMFAGWQAAKWWDRRQTRKTVKKLEDFIIKTENLNRKLDEDARGGA